MSSLEPVLHSLGELAQNAAGVLEFRRAALAVIAEVIRFDAALFHELSPRVGLERAALVGIEVAALEAGRGSWDENAVLFARLRELALEQGGVAADHEAFPPGSRARKAWDDRIARPLKVRAALAGHLIVREKIIGAVFLFRRSGTSFTARDQATLRTLVPVLSIADGMQQALAGQTLAGATARLRCVDQRLTSRQREIVERVALGHTNAQIGDALGVSSNTVRNLLTDVRSRLGAANRAEIVRVAVLR